MRIRSIIAVVLVIAVAALTLTMRTSAQEKKHPIDVWMDKQLEQASGDAEMQRITAQATEKWDAELNKNYGALVKKLNAEQKTALLTSQRAWLAYRDAEFKTIGLLNGGHGQMGLTMAADDRMQIVKARAVQLAEYLETVKE